MLSLEGIINPELDIWKSRKYHIIPKPIPQVTRRLVTLCGIPLSAGMEYQGNNLGVVDCKKCLNHLDRAVKIQCLEAENETD